MQILHMLPNEVIGILMYTASLSILFLLYHFFSKEGLFLFFILSVIIANLQALKAIHLHFFNYPIAMGSILFTMSLLAIDMLTEFYGSKQAKKAIWLGFAGMVMMSVFMLLTLGAKVVEVDPGHAFYPYIEAHRAMTVLFTPAPALLCASLIAYLASQYTDMIIFIWLQKYTTGRFLGLRTGLATLFAALIDNSLFSVLAWKIFHPLSIDFKTFLVTYVLGTFGLRAMISIINMPFMYVFRRQYRSLFNDASVS